MSITRSLIVSLAALMSSHALAQVESPQKFDNYLVHFNALSSQNLQPQMAKQYGIERSSKNGLLTIVVQKHSGDGNDTPVNASISGKAVSLTGLETPLRMREIREGGDISYIGEFAVKGPDTYRFTVSIKPEGAARGYTLKFEQNYAAN